MLYSSRKPTNRYWQIACATKIVTESLPRSIHASHEDIRSNFIEEDDVAIPRALASNRQTFGWLPTRRNEFLLGRGYLRDDSLLIVPKNSEICAKIIYSVFNATFKIKEFIATAGGSSAAGLLEGTKAQEVVDKLLFFRSTNSRVWN